LIDDNAQQSEDGRQSLEADENSGVWVFFYLKQLMTHVPVSNKELAQAANISDAVVSRARSGKGLKKATQVKIFDALVKSDKLAAVRSMRGVLIQAKGSPTPPRSTFNTIVGF
jgi:DNA-binding Xre family transcriptional regulator